MAVIKPAMTVFDDFEPPDNPLRRCRILEFSPEFVLSLFCRSHGPIAYEVHEGVPDDARVMGWQYDADRNVVQALLVSPSFDPIPDGLVPPTIGHLMITRYYGDGYAKRLAEYEREQSDAGGATDV